MRSLINKIWTRPDDVGGGVTVSYGFECSLDLESFLPGAAEASYYRSLLGLHLALTEAEDKRVQEAVDRLELEILGESVDRYLIPQTEEDQERKRKLDELVQPDR